MQLKGFYLSLMCFITLSCAGETEPIDLTADPFIGTWDVSANPNGHHTLGVNESGVFGISHGGNFNFLGRWKNCTTPQNFNALNQYYQMVLDGASAEEEDTLHIVFESNFKAFHYGGPEGTIYRKRK